MDLPCFSLQNFEERIKNETPADPLCDGIGQGDKDECQKGGKSFVDLLKVNIDHCPDHVKPDKDKCGSGGNYRDRFDQRCQIKKRKGRKRSPTITAVRPVLPPASIPAARHI